MPTLEPLDGLTSENIRSESQMRCGRHSTWIHHHPNGTMRCQDSLSGCAGCLLVRSTHAYTEKTGNGQSTLMPGSSILPCFSFIHCFFRAWPRMPGLGQSYTTNPTYRLSSRSLEL